MRNGGNLRWVKHSPPVFGGREDPTFDQGAAYVITSLISGKMHAKIHRSTSKKEKA